MSLDLPIVIRPMVASDYGFVLQSWSKTFHEVEPIKYIKNDVYVPWQTARINHCISTALVLIAHLEDEPDSIAGFICARQMGSDLLLHWCNVKGVFRRFGVAKALLNQFQYEKIHCSHYFKLYRSLKDRYPLEYNPTLINI